MPGGNVELDNLISLLQRVFNVYAGKFKFSLQVVSYIEFRFHRYRIPRLKARGALVLQLRLQVQLKTGP